MKTISVEITRTLDKCRKQVIDELKRLVKECGYGVDEPINILLDDDVDLPKDSETECESQSPPDSIQKVTETGLIVLYEQFDNAIEVTFEEFSTEILLDVLFETETTVSDFKK